MKIDWCDLSQLSYHCQVVLRRMTFAIFPKMPPASSFYLHRKIHVIESLLVIERGCWKLKKDSFIHSFPFISDQSNNSHPGIFLRKQQFVAKHILQHFNSLRLKISSMKLQLNSIPSSTSLLLFRVMLFALLVCVLECEYVCVWSSAIHTCALPIKFEE